MLLSLLCYLFARGKLKLPASRAELFEEAVEERFTARSAKTEKDDRQRVLEECAFHSFFCGGRQAEIPERMLLSVARKVAGKKNGSLIKEEALQSGLLTKNGSNSYSFLHPRFQEYFAAAALQRRAEEEPEGRRWFFEDEPYWCQTCDVTLVPFSHYFWHADWQDTITLLAGLLDDATPLLKRLQVEPDDVFHQMLTLAAYCLSSAKEVEEKIGREIVGAVCQEWWKVVKEREDFSAGMLKVLSQGRQKKWSEQVYISLDAWLKHEDEDIRYIAVNVLGEIKATTAVPGLLQALKGNAPGLLQALRDKDKEVRKGKRALIRNAAAEALANIGNPAAIQPLLSAARRERWLARSHLWRAVWTLSQEAKVRIYEDGRWESLPPIEPSSVAVTAHPAREERQLLSALFSLRRFLPWR